LQPTAPARSACIAHRGIRRALGRPDRRADQHADFPVAARAHLGFGVAPASGRWSGQFARRPIADSPQIRGAEAGDWAMTRMGAVASSASWTNANQRYLVAEFACLSARLRHIARAAPSADMAAMPDLEARLNKARTELPAPPAIDIVAETFG